MPLGPNFTWVSNGLENVPPDGFPTSYPLASTSELTAPYREHALQMNSLAIRGVKICDYYRFSFLTRLVDLIGMVWLNCEPVQDLGERAATNNHTKPTTKKNKPIPSLPYTKEQGAHTPSPLLGRTKQPFHGLSKRIYNYARGTEPKNRTLSSHRKLCQLVYRDFKNLKNDGCGSMSEWTYRSLSGACPANELPSNKGGRTKQPCHGLSKHLPPILEKQKPLNHATHPSENSARSRNECMALPFLERERALKHVT
eukprot:sb/3468611/